MAVVTAPGLGGEWSDWKRFESDLWRCQGWGGTPSVLAPLLPGERPSSCRWLRIMGITWDEDKEEGDGGVSDE